MPIGKPSNTLIAVHVSRDGLREEKALAYLQGMLTEVRAPAITGRLRKNVMRGQEVASRIAYEA